MSRPASPDPLHFRILLEDDPIKNAQLGSTLSQSSPSPKHDTTPALSNELSSSAGYVDASFTTAQSLPDSHALIVLHLTLHPSVGYRFGSVTVTWKFLHDSAQITAHAPRRSYGGITVEKRRTTWGIELPLKISATSDVHLTPKAATETEQDVEHCMTITGTARGFPKKNYLVWTLEENSSSATGLPSEVQLAAMARQEGDSFPCTVDLRARLEGGIRPRYLRSKSNGSSGRGWETCLEPAKLVGRLKEFDRGADIDDFKKVLQGWTGEVEGSVVQYGLPIVRA